MEEREIKKKKTVKKSVMLSVVYIVPMCLSPKGGSVDDIYILLSFCIIPMSLSYQTNQ